MIKNDRPCGSKEECKAAPGYCEDCKEFIIYNKIELLNDIIDRIQCDKNTFEYCGRDTKGHFRSIMLIEEYAEELIDSIKNE